MKKVMFMGLILGAITAAGYADPQDGIYSFKTGQFDIFMLVESERDGNAGILVGADEALLKRLIPASGFKHTANAFLIRAGGRNILVDSGTGTGDIIIGKIKKLGVEPEQIEAVLITHLHGDHFGSLQRNGKAVFPKAKVYLSAKEHEHFTKTAPNQNAIAALAPYGSQVITFEPGDLGSPRLRELLPGITPIAAYGHTPGHTIFLIENSGAKFLIIADLLHVALVQFPRPDISATYDMDQKAAASIRRQVLDYAAKNKITVGGMHIVYPGTGSVSADGTGYKFTPGK
ncbi:MAG: MBL fold metallo-hydrolase [Treponema sp.]|jgi:glyoxylase-like metal-dependent hydrolase (beta-lactamase superfamily II)|nr:MBL fold metallo-hydrolase [Treponema sp.]